MAGTTSNQKLIDWVEQWQKAEKKSGFQVKKLLDGLKER